MLQLIRTNGLSVTGIHECKTRYFFTQKQAHDFVNSLRLKMRSD
jgi:hypothetical protein